MNNVSLTQAVRQSVKPKFYGHTVLNSKVVTYFPDNLIREYARITNTYMTLLNKELAAELPVIRRTMDADRQNIRHDDALSIQAVIADTFMRIQRAFERKTQLFGLEDKLESLANMTRKLKISEWKRVVHQTLGVNIMDDYYMGEFFSHALKQWTANNVSLIKTIPQETLSRMSQIVLDGYLQGRSNTSIGNDIQEAYGIGRRHAQFIARDQIAKLNSNITQAQQQDAGVEEYVWSSSGDIRVRDSHAALNGKRFRWDDPPVVDETTGRRASVGLDYNCRCVGLPVFNIETLNLPWERTDD